MIPSEAVESLVEKFGDESELDEVMGQGAAYTAAAYGAMAILGMLSISFQYLIGGGDHERKVCTCFVEGIVQYFSA